MKTTCLSGIFLLYLCLISFASCNNDELEDRVETIKLFVSAETSSYIPSGSSLPIGCLLVKEENDSEYKKLDFSGITGFEYEHGYEYELLVEKTTLAEPPADASNITYRLKEIISQAVPSSVLSIQTVFAVDAEQKDLIETDLKNNLPIPDGCSYVMNFGSPIIVVPAQGTCAVVDADNTLLASGTISWVSNGIYPDIPELPASYKLLPVDAQIISCMKWTFDISGTKQVYDMFLVEKLQDHLCVYHFWLYEDLTEYYKMKYPDAGVKGVVRVQILSPQTNVLSILG